MKSSLNTKGVVYICGDTHGILDSKKIKNLCAQQCLTYDDFIIICGDSGIVWSEETLKDAINFDALTFEVLKYAVNTQKISISRAQMIFKIGYPRAEKIISYLADKGFISQDVYPRNVYLTQKKFEELFEV